MENFTRDPMHQADIPQHLNTMLQTQGIAERAQKARAFDMIRWSLMLSDFIRRRSARIIAKKYIAYFYRPGGKWFKKFILQYNEYGLNSFTLGNGHA